MFIKSMYSECSYKTSNIEICYCYSFLTTNDPHSLTSKIILVNTISLELNISQKACECECNNASCRCPNMNFTIKRKIIIQLFTFEHTKHSSIKFHSSLLLS